MRASGSVLAVALAVCLGAPALAAGAEMPDPFPQAAAAYLVAVDGRTLWSRRPTAPLPPASLTKIMTALLVLERTAPGDRVTVRTAAVRESGSRLGLRAGEVMAAGDLLAAMVLTSANDACRALADHVAGNETRFVALMNRRAAELGLARTRFRNACGHDQPGHRSSARDLAVLARAAMAHRGFAALTATVRTTVATAGGRRFELENKNELIGRYPGAVGVKTGFTAQAGKCIVAAVERDGRHALLVLLNAPDRWWTAVAMLDRAFAVATASQPPAVR